MNFVTTRWRVYFVSHEVLWIDMQQRYVKTSSYCISNFFMESRESCLAADGRAWKVDGRAQALVGPGLATPLSNTRDNYSGYSYCASRDICIL